MTRGLFNRAKLLAIVAGLAIAMAACAAPAASDPNGPTATSPSGQPTQQTQATATTEPAEELVQQAIGGELFLQVDSPAESEMFVTTDSIQVSGHTTVDALLSVNDAVMEIDAEGRFNHVVQLEIGPNLIEVVASDAEGQQMDEVLLVIYEPA